MKFFIKFKGADLYLLYSALCYNFGNLYFERSCPVLITNMLLYCFISYYYKILILQLFLLHLDILC